ncbi:MAG: hypothetical protein Q8N62_06930 [Candidatus Omnitrophota bacterium]|nr:hypothetical protein [Candidatus Omnitrophota bacterium]
MKAFVGHSFADDDQGLKDKIISFLTEREVVCVTGEKAQNKSVSLKVRERIEKNDIFIGLFTIDQEIQQLSSLPENKQVLPFFSNIFSKKTITKKKKENSPLFTTSNWVIQESGYAIGKSKEVILLVEEGIYKFPELQGDKEIIPFRRNDLSTALLKLSDIIQAIKSGAKPSEQTVAQSIIEQKNNEKEEDKIAEDRIIDKLSYSEMFDAYGEKNIAKVDDIYQDHIRKNLKEENRIFWDSLILNWKYSLGDVLALSKLEEMFEESKNFEVGRQLASCYSTADKQDTARELLQQCASLTEKSSEKTECFIQISKCYLKENEFDLAMDTLLALVNDSIFKDNLESIFVNLINIAEKKNDDYLYIIFSEKALDVNPVNTSLRFNLAFKYGNLEKKEDLAIYHYKKLLSVEDNVMALNNIGVEYSNLDMKVNGVMSYMKAIEKKNTLAFANVAYKYLNEGFTDLADELLKKADKLSNEGIEVHENIGFAKNKLKKILKEESTKENEVMDLANKIHKFKVMQSDAYCLKNVKITSSEVSGIWVMEKWGEVNVTFDMENKTFKGEQSLRIAEEPSGYWGRISLLGAFTTSSPATTNYKIRKIEIQGSINNLAGKYTIKVTEEKESSPIALPKSILEMSSQGEIYSSSGFLIINDSKNMSILEEDSKNNRLFSHWNKKIA